ncbi:MAG: MinD/ParA family protein [Phycisphaerales bacterium]
MTQFVTASDTQSGEGDPEGQRPPQDDQASRLRQLVSKFERDDQSTPESADPQTQHKPGWSPPPRRIPVIAIASGKGGVGKTTTSVNLSIALARQNRQAVLLDADLGLANADVLCGLMPKARLESAIDTDESASLSDLAIEAPGGFRLIPGSVGIGRVGELDQAERSTLLSRLEDLQHDNDVVLIDTSAGLGDSVTTFVEAADLGLIVVTPEPTSVADAYALIKVLIMSADGLGESQTKRPRPKLAMIVNQAANEKEANQVYARMAGVCDRFLGYQIPMLGYVRSDKRVVKAVKARSPYMIETPKSPAGRDMTKLAASLVEWAGIEGRALAASSKQRFFARR